MIELEASWNILINQNFLTPIHKMLLDGREAQIIVGMLTNLATIPEFLATIS